MRSLDFKLSVNIREGRRHMLAFYEHTLFLALQPVVLNFDTIFPLRHVSFLGPQLLTFTRYCSSFMIRRHLTFANLNVPYLSLLSKWNASISFLKTRFGLKLIWGWVLTFQFGRELYFYLRWTAGTLRWLGGVDIAEVLGRDINSLVHSDRRTLAFAKTACPIFAARSFKLSSVEPNLFVSVEVRALFWLLPLNEILKLRGYIPVDTSTNNSLCSFLHIGSQSLKVLTAALNRNVPFLNGDGFATHCVALDLQNVLIRLFYDSSDTPRRILRAVFILKGFAAGFGLRYLR